MARCARCPKGLWACPPACHRPPGQLRPLTTAASRKRTAGAVKVLRRTRSDSSSADHELAGVDRPMPAGDVGDRLAVTGSRDRQPRVSCERCWPRSLVRSRSSASPSRASPPTSTRWAASLPTGFLPSRKRPTSPRPAFARTLSPGRELREGRLGWVPAHRLRAPARRADSMHACSRHQPRHALTEEAFLEDPPAGSTSTSSTLRSLMPSPEELSAHENDWMSTCPNDPPAG